MTAARTEPMPTVVLPPADVPPPPIAGAGLWLAVMTAAGYRCQCSGACGATHRKSGGRCDHQHGGYGGKGRPRVRLDAAPADLSLPEHVAAELPPDQLRAWCSDCRGAAERRIRRSVNSEPEQQDTLW